MLTSQQQNPTPWAPGQPLRSLQVMIIGAQTGLLYWKNKHKRSYELVSSCCMNQQHSCTAYRSQTSSQQLLTV
jgi:hypothetical protein